MNKQAAQNTDSASNLEAGRTTKSNLDTFSTIPRRYKVIIILAGVLAIIAICAIVAIAVGLLILKIHTVSQTSEYDRKHLGDRAGFNMEESDQLVMNVRLRMKFID